MSSEDLKRQLAEAQERARQATNTRIEKGNDWAKSNREHENADNALANVGENIEEKESRLAQMLELEVRNAMFQESAEVEVLKDKVSRLELKLESKKEYDDSEIRGVLEELEGKVKYLTGDSEYKDKQIQDLITQNEELKKQLENRGLKAFFKRLLGK